MINRTSLSRIFTTGTISAAIALAMACGGGDDDGGSGPTATSESSSSPPPTSTTSAPSSSADIPIDTAEVTIGNTTYEFTMAGPFGDQCLTLFGVLGGGGQASNGDDVRLDIEIPPVGYESDPRFSDFDPPQVRVEDDVNDRDWQAGGDFSIFPNGPEPGQSQVDSYTSDGKYASGTATFMDMTAVFRSGGTGANRPTPVQGTFKLHCG